MRREHALRLSIQFDGDKDGGVAATLRDNDRLLAFAGARDDLARVAHEVADGPDLRYSYTGLRFLRPSAICRVGPVRLQTPSMTS